MKPRYPIPVFLVSIVIAMIILPQGIFVGFYSIIAALFILTFSLSMVCISRNIVEKSRENKAHHHSAISLVASILGFSAFHVCSSATGVCASGVGFLLLSFLPAAAIGFTSGLSIALIIISIIIQTIALWHMGCYRNSFQKLLGPGIIKKPRYPG